MVIVREKLIKEPKGTRPQGWRLNIIQNMRWVRNPTLRKAMGRFIRDLQSPRAIEHKFTRRQRQTIIIIK